MARSLSETDPFYNTAFLSTLQATVGSIGGVGSLASVLGSVGTVAAVTGYSRELETEADTEGFKLIVKAGYDPREAPKLFLHLKEELEEEKIKENYFFGSHPSTEYLFITRDGLLLQNIMVKKSGIDAYLKHTNCYTAPERYYFSKDVAQFEMVLSTLFNR